ncbi:MAG: MBOAT family protein [Spirulina sp. SIO3F2]|nr:MBOAT family protein [Spirulina sp. SIO3F2]
MLFNSFTFVALVLLTLAVYYLPPLRSRQVWILVIASLIFYAWNTPILLVLLLVSIALNVATSYQILHAAPRARVGWAIAGVSINLAVLATFKYAGLLTALLFNLLGLPLPETGDWAYLLLTLPLPVGISFYTFQGMSLVIDVLRNHQGSEADQQIQARFFAQLSPLQYALRTSFFLAFFPQLVAGPIVRANDFYPQIQPKRWQEIHWPLVFQSLVSGYFFKMVIADNLKDYTFWITYPYYQGLSTITNLSLLFGYSMQIFADFAGYSLIAIGIAAAFGYRLPDNFNFPYISRSIAEFWRRWHISLSTWLKLYLYIPLGGNRRGAVRTYFNLIVVMTLGGLWHGAAWSYAVWGLFHGVGLAVERLLNLPKRIETSLAQASSWLRNLVETVQVFAVFLFVSLGWLLFKLPRFEQAIDFVVTLFRNWQLGPDLVYIVPVFFLSLPVVLYHLPHFPMVAAQLKSPVKIGRTWTGAGQELLYGAMLVLIAINSGSANEFIYFQF